ncbi:copper amine oxidase N-terminal domain-containing protein [Cohnella kolymensis]|uniref:copper amine oxidase N-terminal domain-containing protein n=1 Tax=Cohnella kolymensis TaxID=1590652 RepID=UPI000A7B965C|nr:copper amine oxidase N-terminal domain-containing protein [Cohnella kolymensis]
MSLWGKTALIALLGTTLASGVPLKPSAAAAAVPNVKIILDDVPLAFNAAPTVKNNVTMVPFRSIGEALGIKVDWDGKNKAVIAQTVVDGEAKKVVLRLGQKTADVNGKKVALLSAPLVVNDNILIPLRFFSTEFGAQVGWSGAAQTVTIVLRRRKYICALSMRSALSNKEVKFPLWIPLRSGGVTSMRKVNLRLKAENISGLKQLEI